MHSFVLLMSHNMREKLESFTSLFIYIWFTNKNVIAMLADMHNYRQIYTGQTINSHIDWHTHAHKQASIS